MRKLMIALIVAGFGSAAQADAPLGKGEALFQLQATGRIVQKADHIETSCTFTGVGTDKAAALMELEKLKAKIPGPLKALGINASAISYSDAPTYNRYHYYGEDDEAVEAIEAAAAGVVAKKAPKKKKVAYSQGATIKLNSLQQNDEIENVLTENGCENPSISRFSINNMADALLKAKDAAIGEAQKEAERYAANLGLKVVRIVRVSEYSPLSALIGADTSHLISSASGALMDYDYSRGRYARRFLGLTDDPDAYVTWKTLWVDFILGPK
jgi:uncharacterized protein YggE